MSSEALVEGPDGVVAAWETAGQVYFAGIKRGTAEVGTVRGAPGEGRGRKHPAVTVNAKGETICVWTEGTGWEQGGALAWQVFDKEGRPTAEKGRRDRAIPVWGLPTVVTDRDGGFVIIH
jgi:hypothetical protein